MSDTPDKCDTDATLSDTTELIDAEAVEMVRCLALRVCGRLPLTVPVSDLISAGHEALVRAAGRYQPHYGGSGTMPFRAFARHRVSGAILDHLRERDKDRGARSIEKRYEETRREMAQEQGGFPSRAEVAERMGITLSALDQAILAPVPEVSQRETEIDGRMLHLDPVSRQELPDVLAERAEMRRLLDEVGRCLLPRERRVLELYYGEDMLLREIGALFGVNESRVSQIRIAAVSKARALLAARGVGFNDLPAAA